MNFLDKDESRLLEKKLRREMSAQVDPKFVLYYESGARDYSGAAKTIAQSAGRFSEATVLFEFCVSGNGSVEDCAIHSRWARYQTWRAANNEDRRLFEAPGHRFEPHDVEQFSRTLEFGLELGWDAVIAARPGRQLMFLSHDDRLEIYRGFNGRELVRQLVALGYWRQAAA